ncbi:MAG TPA: T9SS type A sorting domain-containing protein [Parafilimonas sp.]|nr:T9SS type A sorting domain-containing protein [Parafilimonas sp.]
MNKIYTKHFGQGLRKVLLAVTFGILMSVFQSYAPPSSFFGEASIQAKTIKCYPNPAISFINFEFKNDFVSKDYSLSVYSFTGKKVSEINITSAKTTLTFTNEFYRGIYVYQLRDKSGKIIETGKFQVVK